MCLWGVRGEFSMIDYIGRMSFTSGLTVTYGSDPAGDFITEDDGRCISTSSGTISWMGIFDNSQDRPENLDPPGSTRKDPCEKSTEAIGGHLEYQREARLSLESTSIAVVGVLCRSRDRHVRGEPPDSGQYNNCRVCISAACAGHCECMGVS
jgi:hypothetical protein